MTTPVETMLREGLRELATVPGPRSLADRALARAARMRRRRIVFAGAGVVVLAAALAVPIAGYELGVTPFGTSSDKGGSCKTVTDETDPAQGVPRGEWPTFVTLAVAAMPPRDDYSLQSGYGVCPQVGAAAGGKDAYAVINLGNERQHGHVTITLRHMDVATCAALPNEASITVEFCDERTATTPLVFGLSFGDSTLSVFAVYADGRAVTMQSNNGALDRDDLKRVVTDKALADLLL